jgi:hypothetical protein
MRTHAALFLLLLASFPLAAQSRNAAYIEVAGNAVVPSVNYERHFAERWYGRVGLAVVIGRESDGDEDVTFAVPLMIGGYSHPHGNHHFETAGGVTFVTGDSQDLWDEGDEEISNLVGTATIGYRYQKPGRGFVFRAGFTPIFDGADVLPWAGVSFGYAW